jgi:hypothetical protein
MEVPQLNVPILVISKKRTQLRPKLTTLPLIDGDNRISPPIKSCITNVTHQNSTDLANLSGTRLAVPYGQTEYSQTKRTSKRKRFEQHLIPFDLETSNQTQLWRKCCSTRCQNDKEVSVKNSPTQRTLSIEYSKDKSVKGFALIQANVQCEFIKISFVISKSKQLLDPSATILLRQST